MSKKVLTYLFFLLPLVSLYAADSLTISPKQLILENKTTEALKILEPRLENEPSFSDYYNAGIAYEKTNQLRSALWAFESAIKIDPSAVNAQKNAAFIYKKLTSGDQWSNPYSWTDRMIVAFRSLWLPLIIISSLCVSLAIFLSLAQVKMKRSWIKKSWFPASLILMVALFGQNKLSNHYANPDFAIPKENYLQLFISPNGVPLEEDLTLPLRNEFVQYSEDSNSVCVLNNKERLWVSPEDLLIY
jgi:tetratricopeptide (TPR) repeat protein